MYGLFTMVDTENCVHTGGFRLTDSRKKFLEKNIVKHGIAFTVYDDDGEPNAIGTYIVYDQGQCFINPFEQDEEIAFYPLNVAQSQFGSTKIRYFTSRGWEML